MIEPQKWEGELWAAFYDGAYELTYFTEMPRLFSTKNRVEVNIHEAKPVRVRVTIEPIQEATDGDSQKS